MEFNFGSRSAPRHGTERERERSNPVRFLASQRTVIECKCNNRVATYYLRKPYFVFRVVIPLHSSSSLSPQANGPSSTSFFSSLSLLSVSSLLLHPYYYYYCLLRAERPTHSLLRDGMGWNGIRKRVYRVTLAWRKMICESAELDWEEVWLARSWDLFQRGLMLGDGFLALGFVPAMRIGVVERVIRRGGINFLSPDRKLESSGRLKFSWWPEESMRGIFINKKDEGCVRRKGKVEIIFLNDRRKIMSYRVIEEDLTFSFFLHPFLHP